MAAINAENISDDCHVEISTATAAIKPSASKSRKYSCNDLKLAKYISNTFQNFNDYLKQPVSTITDQNNSKIGQKLTSSYEHTTKNMENSLGTDIHVNNTVRCANHIKIIPR